MSDVRAERSRPTTTEDFLTWPGDDEAKRYELVDGVVRAMAPTRPMHGLIQATLGALLRQHLRDGRSPCKVLAAPAIRPRLRAESNLRIPDLGVTCAPIAADQVIVEDPILLVEILSPSNKAKTWTNVWTYTTIPSVREIVVVQSQKIEIQVLRVSDERIWPDNPEVLRVGDTLRLDGIGFACPVEAVYADTPFA